MSKKPAKSGFCAQPVPVVGLLSIPAAGEPPAANDEAKELNINTIYFYLKRRNNNENDKCFSHLIMRFYEI